MPSSTAPISCSRETCFSALSWRRAPTKSRLIDRLLSRRCQATAGPIKKRGGHPRHGAAVQFARVYPGCVDGSNGRGEPPGDVVLEDVDEFRHQAVAAERPVEPAIDE